MARDEDDDRTTALQRLEPDLRERVLTVLRPLSPEGRRMTAMHRLDTLLSVPDPQTFVPALPTEELYFFLQDIGLDDCTELVRYASDEQLQGFVDLAAWQKDTFDLDAFHRWFRVAEHNGPDEVRRLLRSVDPELVVLLLLRTATIHDAREAPEDVPDDKTLLPTPDGAYMLELDEADDRLPLVKAALDALYAGGVEEARRFLQAARWEVPAELEETCYRWRAGRLEDMGFLPVEEAAQAEQDIDIAQLERALRQGTSAGEPGYEPGDVHPFTGWFVARSHDAPYLERVLGELPSGPARDRFLHGFVHLVNRRLSLRGLDVGEWETLEQESTHAVRMVSIGLERLVRGTGTSGVELLGRLPLLACYRVGRTLLSGLQRRAVDLIRRGDVATGQNPFDPPLDWWLDALRQTPPHRYAVPQARTRSAATGEPPRREDFFVPFRTLAEVDEAGALLARGEAVLFFFEHRYGWGPDRFRAADLAALDDAQRTAATFSTLLLTGMANRILDRTADLTPLTAEDVRDLVDMLFVPAPEGGRRIDPRLRREAQDQLVAVSGKLKDAEREALFAFVNEALTRLEEALQSLPPGATPDVRYLGDVLLVRA